jgi:glycosyltransferase involved in cell wall biosynthesis
VERLTVKIAWIAPQGELCGIGRYAEKYADALSKHAILVKCDPREFLHSRRAFIKKTLTCDLAHIQYEPSFFLHGSQDFYPALCRAVSAKKIVSLHEIYDKIPGVFPREHLSGGRIAKRVRQLLWDFRHPHWAAYYRHAARNFFADAILVHARFHQAILERAGVSPSTVTVVPLPVRYAPDAASTRLAESKGITLGATGFINPLFDYDLMLDVVERLPATFRFVWVGGTRPGGHESLEQILCDKIEKRGLRDRCEVTGRVSDVELARQFARVQIFCAFFTDRSSSESLAEAIAERKYIVATRIPLTEELVGCEPLAVLADHRADKLTARIRDLAADEPRQRALERACTAYGRRFSYESCSREVAEIYERLLST